VQQLFPLKPVVVIAEAVDTIEPRQLYLPGLNLRQAQVVKSQLTRQTRLMVPLELRLTTRDRRPLREALPPPSVVFGNRMKLRQVESDQFDSRLDRHRL